MAKFDVEYESSVDTLTVAILDSLTDSSVTWTELHGNKNNKNCKY